MMRELAAGGAIRNGNGRLAQPVRASALQAEGHPFDPDTAHQLHLVILRLSDLAIGRPKPRKHHSSFTQSLNHQITQ